MKEANAMKCIVAKEIIMKFKRLMPLLVLFLVACGSETSGSPSGSNSNSSNPITATPESSSVTNLPNSSSSTADPVVPATGVALLSTINELEVGKTTTLTANVLPDNATDKSLTFSSNNDARATVSSAGMVTAIAVGEVTITATSHNAVSNSITLTVIPAIIPVSKVTLTAAVSQLAVGNKTQITAAILPVDATDKSLTYVSSATSIATVSSSGEITAVAVGPVTITATSSNSISGTLDFTIIPKPVEKTLTINGNSTSLSTTTEKNATFTVNEITFAFGKGKTTSADKTIFMINTNGYMYNTTSLGDISSIKMTYGADGSASTAQNFIFGTSAITSAPASSEDYDVLLTTSPKGQTVEIKPKTSGNGFFRFDITKNNLQASSIVITYTL